MAPPEIIPSENLPTEICRSTDGEGEKTGRIGMMQFIVGSHLAWTLSLLISRMALFVDFE
jgi:hypothetical protein